MRYYIRYNDCLIRSKEQFELAVQLFFRFFIVCVSISKICFLSKRYVNATFNESQFLFTRQIFSNVNSRHFEWWWRKFDFVVIIAFTFLKFLFFIEYNYVNIVKLTNVNRNCNLSKEILQIWTFFNTIFLKFLFFNLIHWSILIDFKDYRKWKFDFIDNFIFCFAIVFATLIFSMTW